MSHYHQLQNLLSQSLTQYPDKISLQFEQTTFTYRTLAITAQKLAQGMGQQGIKFGDRVAWFMPNCPEAVIISFACYWIGAISVPLNDRDVTEEAQAVLEEVEAKILFFYVVHHDIVSQLVEMIPGLKAIAVGTTNSPHLTLQELLNSSPLAEPAPVEPEHPALILYTSGSTGRPKGVVHSHYSAFNGIDISRQIFDIIPEDQILIGKPISHAGGLETQLMPTLLAGGTAILAHKPSPQAAVELIQTFEVTQYAMLASDLLDFIEAVEAHPSELPSLRNCIGSGDAVPTDLHHRFRSLFGWEVMEGSGMTEIGGYYAVNPRYGKEKMGFVRVTSPQY